MEKLMMFVTQVQSWSELLEKHAFAGINQILEECNNNETVLKVALMIIVGLRPEHADLVNSYYNSGISCEENISEDQGFYAESFEKYSAFIENRFDAIFSMLNNGQTYEGLRELEMTGTAISRYAQQQLAVIGKPTGNNYDHLYKAVTDTRGGLDSLEKVIATQDQDQMLAELIAFKRTSETLESYVQQLIVNTL